MTLSSLVCSVSEVTILFTHSCQAVLVSHVLPLPTLWLPSDSLFHFYFEGNPLTSPSFQTAAEQQTDPSNTHTHTCYWSYDHHTIPRSQNSTLSTNRSLPMSMVWHMCCVCTRGGGKIDRAGITICCAAILYRYDTIQYDILYCPLRLKSCTSIAALQ